VEPWTDLVDRALEVGVVGSFTNVGLRVRRRVGRWTDPAPDALAGRSVMITGTTSGIGRAAATACARLGATVHTVGRDPERTAVAAQEIAEAAGGATVHAWTADLGDLASVRTLATDFLAAGHPLDSLVHNAGALLARRTLSPQGHEATVATMVLGPTLLTESLAPLLAASGAALVPPIARVVFVASGGMYLQGVDAADPLGERSDRGYRGTVAYARAKRAQVVLTDRWAHRWPGVAVHAMHPGWAATPGVHESLPRFERVLGPWLRTPTEGADTIVWLLTDPAAAGMSGRFWHDRRERTTIRVPGTATSPGTTDRLVAAIDDALSPWR